MNEYEWNHDWTEKEIMEYQVKRTKNPSLRALYALEGISSDKPEERIRFLSEKIILDMNKEKKDKIRDIARRGGKVNALLELERIALEGY